MSPSPPEPRPPSVDRLVREMNGVDLPHPLLVEAAREALAAGDPGSGGDRARALARSLLGVVVNGTGVIVHTNLGRSPLPTLSTGPYTNLELDLESGRRGSRQTGVGGLLARLTGAEAALVVNNGAAALVLVLAALAPGRAVVVSRGELVEIGGGFRLPEILTASGARLAEVGTTNRTRLSDYGAAMAADPDVALVLKVHRSNYRVVGFTAEVGVAELTGLGPPVVYDIGSGLLDADTPWLGGPPPPWLTGEPGARQSLAQGAALVTFSGDKLMGGPQAGVIAGRADLVEAAAAHPLARALRPGGLVLNALQEVCLTYLRKEKVPFWAMATTGTEELQARATRIVEKVAGVGSAVWSVCECQSVPGGGSLPGTEIDSVGLSAPGDHRAALLRAPVPVVTRVRDDRTIIDLRTVEPDQDADVVVALTL
ncbi:MAG TPA: L-seryl-tRNA(Sec) selenium transferase [Acidimicrobiales bacterium]|nr:L-seryl-tRNA(Sec) selenium transferase [Acidimicrobiales bacterium]